MGSRLQEMATVGMYDGTHYKVAVFDDEGAKPHLHVWWGVKRPEDAKPDCHVCVRLDTSEYFIHRGKTGTFTGKKEKAALVEFLKAVAPDASPLTNFSLAVMLWNLNNPRWRLPRNVEMPDYTRLP
jgi:hypothetical protein